MNRTFLFLLVLVVFSSCKKDVITMESLLSEMTDKSALTYFPKNNYSLKQFSSYDRKSVSPDDKNWWANADYTQFIREEENNGRREFVLFDADGPGAVVRYWMTFAGEGASDGILRIYIDGNKIPEIEGNVLEILSGEFIAPYPLSSSVSAETDYQRRGHNLYLPIPYSKQCKITYECDAVKFENNRWRPSIYYNINYRSYEPEVEVVSFSKEELKKSKDLIIATCNRLLDEPEITRVTVNKSTGIKTNDSLTINFNKKGQAISQIALKLDAQNINQALRSTVLSIKFDGEETVWVPVGEFFGTGYQLNSSKTWYSKVDDNGWMEASWMMSFKNSAKVSVVNFGKEPVYIDLKVSSSPYKWKKSSMYFGASWHEYNRIHTASDPALENHEWHYDVNYVDLTGQGVYVGDALTVFNTVDAWWGEGDEKIFVDGEEFPSCIGTGTEDYYGYAWCRPEKFTHAFIAQPTGAGNFHPGMTVNMRYRSLDAMPFNRELSSNIEMWHWVKTKMNYAMTAMWYAKPGTKSNVLPDIESVKKQVALKRSDIYKPVVNNDGIIEGEHLEIISAQSGTATTQSGDFGWSGESQLWWRNGEAGDELISKFIINNTGKYKVSAQLTMAVDYGIIQLYLNGKPVGIPINCFNETAVLPFQVELGNQVLSEGVNIFSVKIIGADKLAKPGNMAGIDYLKLEKVE
ncbi:MAG: glycoside hydrolase family 172 protein [Bacteroidota bacterium]